MTDFWVGEFRVDVARAKVVSSDQAISLEPRVLKVLLTLAETPGEVVTHETLLEKVWPNVVVAPNAVQRCIGQLRKTFGDDAKQQKVIVTHPKVGYSLIAKVEKTDCRTPKKSSNSGTTHKDYRIHWFFGVVLIILIAFFLLRPPFPSNTAHLPFEQLTPLTSTDEKEYYPNFSPDGRYLVFNRYIAACENELWIKDLQENTEFQLTRGAGFFGPAAWSPDGNQLAFSSRSGCDASPELNHCRSISAVSFLLAQAEPQTPRELLACDESDYVAVNWLTNDKVAFVDTYARKSKVKSFTLGSGQVALLYQDDQYLPQSLTYSERNKHLAITVHDQIQNTAIVLLNTETGMSEFVPLEIPSDFSDYLLWDPIWHPLKDALLVAARKSLFEIDLEGSFTEYPLTSVSNIYNPTYHPDGNKIVAAMGSFDLDIEAYEIDTSDSNAMTVSARNHQTLYHSTVADYQAKFQTGTSNLSFVSSRSGSEQIWFAENGQLRQLSQFKETININSYAWSPDGQLIALTAKGHLQLLTLDGQLQRLTTPFKVVDVYQWVNAQQLLLSVIYEQQRQVVLFDISLGSYELIYQGFSHWAQLNIDDSLLYTDWHKTLNIYRDNESQVFSSTQHMSLTDGFMVKENRLVYWSDNKLQVYDLENQVFSSVDLPPTSKQIIGLSDVDFINKRLLLSGYREARKDLVLFHND